MTLPLPDSFEIIRGSLGLLDLLGWNLVLASCLKLPGESSRLGATAAHESMATGFGIIDFDNLLLGWRLAIGYVTLFAGV